MSTQSSYIFSLRINIDDRPKGYPFDLPVINSLDALQFHPNVTFIVGENGTGKSTLLEALAVKMGFNPEGGSRFLSFATRETHSQLHRYLTLHKHHIHPENHFFLRAESFYNVATEIDILNKEGPPLLPQYGGKSLHEQSHGESFFSLFMHKFGANGLYILDEPEAALSPGRQMAMLSRMHELVQQNCQFVIATHSPILLSYPGAVIYEINDEGIIKETDYEETDIYTTTKYFLNHYKSMHAKLF
jgi:predicted ATPase